MNGKKTRFLKIEEIDLDRDNPRYKTYSTIDKKDMLYFMFKHSSKKILELLKDIIDLKDLNPLTLIGVVREKSKWVLADGNRRIACLKLIKMDENQRNKIIKNVNFDDLRIFFEKNSAKILNAKNELENQLKKGIEVVVFSNRLEAQRWVERIHTKIGGYTTQAWETFERHLLKGEPISKFVLEKMTSMRIDRNVFVEMVRYSIWSRIFSAKILKDYFCIKRDKDGISIIEIEFEQKINAMITLIENKELSYNKSFVNSSQMRDTIKLIDNKINKLNGKSFSSLKTAQQVIQENSKNQLINKPNSKKNNLEELIRNKKVLNVYKQIDKINKNIYKEMVSLCIRMLIEVSCWEFLKKKMNKSNNWFKESDLKIWIQEVIHEIKKIGIESRNKTTINFIERDLDKFILATNGDIHDVEFISTKEEIKERLVRVKIFLEEIWKKMN